MVQVLAVMLRVVLVVVMVKSDGASAGASVLYMVSVLIVLLRISRPRADIADMPMIPAFGEI